MGVLLLFILLLFTVPAAIITGYFLGTITEMWLGTSPDVSFWLTTIVSFMIFFTYYYHVFTSDPGPQRESKSAFPMLVAGYLIGKITK